MSILQDKFQKIKTKKIKKVESYLNWKSALHSSWSGNESTKNYIDLKMNGMILSLFTNYYHQNLKEQSIDWIIKSMFAYRNKMTDIRLRLADNNIDPKKYILFCFYQLTKLRPTLFNALKWIYTYSLNDFSLWLDSTNGISFKEILNLINCSDEGVKLIEDIGYKFIKENAVEKDSVLEKLQTI